VLEIDHKFNWYGRSKSQIKSIWHCKWVQNCCRGSRSQISYSILDLSVLWLQILNYLKVDHKFHIYDIVDEFKTILVETYHKFHMHYIANDFKIVLVEVDENFHIYNIPNELKIVMVEGNHQFL
jgi:hypothetical protein